MGYTEGRVLVVDDDMEMRSLLEDFLVTKGFDVLTSPTALKALEMIAGIDFDVVISDIKMPELDGLEFTRRVKEACPDLPVVLITAFGSIETAIEAIQMGAFHYIVKPFKLAEITVTIERVLTHRKLQKDNLTLRNELKNSWGFCGVVGKSAGMKAVFELVQRVSQVNSNVLIHGESGTGKEMVAQALHSNGPRAKKPFIAINCTAIPEALLESELFGHAKGAFTGAVQRKRGLFEEADGGTLFLDEIGDMNLALQTKLLRVLQERKVRAVGENISRDIDVRIIAATHKDLKEAMKEGHFREDLYYRLSVIPIMIPPLRERKEDIPVLAEHFLNKFTAMNQVKIKGFSAKAMGKLVQLPWPGNVRELENAVERAVILCSGSWIDESNIPSPEIEGLDSFFTKTTANFPTINELEERYIRLVLEKTGGKKDKASMILGINRRTLYRKEQEYGLS